MNDDQEPVAAELIEDEVPLVLVTDVEMPHMDGFALTRHVRTHPRAANIPIIMITSADDRLKAAAAEAGVTLVLAPNTVSTYRARILEKTGVRNDVELALLAVRQALL